MSFLSLAWRQRVVAGLTLAALIGACRQEEPTKTPAGVGPEPAPGSMVGKNQPEAGPAEPASSGAGKSEAAQEPGQDLPSGHPPMGQPPRTASGAGEVMPPGHPPLDGGPGRRNRPLPAAPPAAAELDGVLTVAGIKFDLPEGWISRKPISRMRLAQYQLPGEAGPADLAVFCFGTGQGGSLQANVNRWLAQFKDPDNPHASPTGNVMTIEQKGLKLSIVKAAGTYSPASMGPMAAPTPPKPDYRLYGLIVEGGHQGNVFVKITGPAATIEAQTDAIAKFANSARLGE